METDADDGDFEVTADMLIHDTIDDETTLAEEEALRTQEEDEAELNELQEEGDMPLEQLLALYGYASAPPTSQKEEPGGSTSPTLAPPSKRPDSSSSVRSRRRNKVVALEPQREIVVESSEESEGERKGAGSTATTAPPPAHEGRSPKGKNTSKDLATENLSQTGTGTDPTSNDTPSAASAVASGSKRAWQEVLEGEDTEGSEVDVIEVDEKVDEALRLVGGDRHMVLEELGLNSVVGMDDIEAGAGLRSEGASVLRMDVVAERGGLEGREDVLVMGGSVREEGEGEGLAGGEGDVTLRLGEGEEGEEEEEEEEGSGAVYEDVMLSSGSSRLYSDSTDDPPMTSSEAPATRHGGNAPTASSTDRTYTYSGPRLRPELPERRSRRLMNIDERALLANSSYFAPLFSDGSDSESDEEYSPREEWKKEVQVGVGYQAIVPDFAPYAARLSSSSRVSCPPPKQLHHPVSSPSCSTSSASSSSASSRLVEPLPQSNHLSCRMGGTDKTSAGDRLMWSPRGVTEEEVSSYLASLSKVVEGVSSNPRKDHEQALQVLLKCNHNTKTALKTMQAIPPVQRMKPWTEDECRRFEEGLRSVRKDFFLLQKKVPTRSVKEVVEFYYLWKKSERYDHFIQQYGKIGRKKVLIPPGHVSDFMEKYLDMHSNDAMDIHYMTTTVQAELKKENS